MIIRCRVLIPLHDCLMRSGMYDAFLHTSPHQVINYCALPRGRHPHLRSPSSPALSHPPGSRVLFSRRQKLSCCNERNQSRLNGINVEVIMPCYIKKGRLHHSRHVQARLFSSRLMLSPSHSTFPLRLRAVPRWTIAHESAAANMDLV